MIHTELLNLSLISLDTYVICTHTTTIWDSNNDRLWINCLLAFDVLLRGCWFKFPCDAKFNLQRCQHQEGQLSCATLVVRAVNMWRSSCIVEFDWSLGGLPHLTPSQRFPCSPSSSPCLGSLQPCSLLAHISISRIPAVRSEHGLEEFVHPRWKNYLVAFQFVHRCDSNCFKYLRSYTFSTWYVA